MIPFYQIITFPDGATALEFAPLSLDGQPEEWQNRVDQLIEDGYNFEAVAHPTAGYADIRVRDERGHVIAESVVAKDNGPNYEPFFQLITQALDNINEAKAAGRCE